LRLKSNALISRDLIHPLDHGPCGIPRPTDVFHHPVAHRIHRIVNDLLLHLPAPEIETILEKRKIPPLGTELLNQRIQPRARARIKSLQLDFPIWLRLENPRPHRFNLARPDPHLPRPVHQLADQLELESRLAKRVDSAVRLTEHPGRF
jgi:hypothetical protein